MTDGSGSAPEVPESPEGPGALDNPAIPSADAVIPPPPPEIPIPDGLLTPPPADVTPVDALIPLPEARRRSDRQRPAILDGEPPAAVADDWAQPSVAPEVPTSGGYRVLTAVIFAFLVVLFIAAIALVIYLVNTTSFPFAGVDGIGTNPLAFAPRF